MSNELKPVAYEVEIQLLTRKGTALLYDKPLSKEDKFTPLYAIPEGYHIVAIDSEQEQRDNLDRHNETVKLRGEEYYQAGYRGEFLSINATGDQRTMYHAGAKDRQRERES